MKGYYTVELHAPGLPAATRVAMETQYVRHLEHALQGHDETLALCLAVGAGAADQAATERLRRAGELAQERVWQASGPAPDRPSEWRFTMRAWTAMDL